MDAALRRQGKERVVATLVQSAAERRPLLITVEDVHWADADTMSLLVAISAATAQSRTVLVMTTRFENDKFDAHWTKMVRGQTMTIIELSPLPLEEARSIARRLTNVKALAEQCVERAGGNPLFLEQLLRGVRDLTDARLPDSIQSVVLARTDLLSAVDRRAIQAASVLGQRFRLPELRTLLADPTFLCDRLVRNALLRQTQDGLQFAHALVREGVYGSLTNARKRQLHRAAAEIFFDDLVLRAEHLDRARDAQAAGAYLAAARMQAGLFRHEQAIALAARGLALAGQGCDAFELAIFLGDLQRDAGRGTEALQAYVRALSESDREVDRCRSLIGCAAANRLIDRSDDAFAALALAEPLAKQSDDNRALAEIHYVRGGLYFTRGRLYECRDEHLLALDAARRGVSPELQARALSGLADVQYLDCRMATALRHFTECVELCETHGLTRIAVPNLVMMGVCRIYTCEFDKALDDMRAGMLDAVRIGDRHAEIMAALSIGSCLSAAGRYHEAENLQPQALNLARALKARRYEAIILCHGAELALVRGLKAEALALARQAREISNETGPGFVGPIVLGLLGLLEDQRENQEAALTAAEALLKHGAVGHNHFWFRRFAMERALLLDDWSEVHRHADALLLRMSEEPLTYACWMAQRAKILARRGSGSAAGTDENDLKVILASAAEVDMRIDALGEALRRN
jgi:tetratricopeptide (TPR) repeat protein